jgi:AIPR protein
MKSIELKKVLIKSDYTRKYPDPLNQNVSKDPYNIEHHILVSRAIDIPSGIPKDPNPRAQRIDYGIYRKVKESLEDTDDLSFHLKNKGITILAHKVDYSPDKRVATIYLAEGDGIADGAHTYEIILASQGNDMCPDGQYIKFEVITGIPRDMTVDITGGLNTAVQVQLASLANLEGKFEWVKDTLKDMPYAKEIAYKENENKPYDIRDILSFLTLFNVNKIIYPKHPKEAYVSKAKCLELYQDDTESFKMLKPLLKDILYLHDYIHIKGKERYNEEKGGKAGKMVGVYTERRKRGQYTLYFMGAETDQILYDGALYPILGAMRFLVEQKSGQNVYSWKLGSFTKVIEFFNQVAPELIATTYNTSTTYGLKPNPIGKDENHWDNLYKTVAIHYMSKYSK